MCCGVANFIGKVEPVFKYAEPTYVDQSITVRGRRAWQALHSVKNPTQDWYENTWLKMVPGLGCSCVADWMEITKQNPPPFGDQASFKQWAIDRHNEVNRKLGKPEWITLSLPRETLPPQRSDKLVLVIAANDWAKSQFEITGPLMREYAAKHGADFHVVLDDAYPHWPMGNKFRLNSFACHYEQTLYLDCDVIVNPDAPNIFDHVPSGQWGCHDEIPHVSCQRYYDDIKIVAEHFGYPVPTRVPNGGVLVVPRDGSAYMPPDGLFPSQWCFDQTWLACRLPTWHEIDERFNWMAIRTDWQGGIEKAWFVHLNGTNREARLTMLSKLAETTRVLQ